MDLFTGYGMNAALGNFRVKLSDSEIATTDFREDKKVWSLPPQHSVKPNCDTAWTKNSLETGIAAVARDNLGKIISVASLKCSAASVRAVEAMVIPRNRNRVVDWIAKSTRIGEVLDDLVYNIPPVLSLLLKAD